MFIIRANYADMFEVKSSCEDVFHFFSDAKNYVELMPNLESIYTDRQQVSHWKISAEVPFVGRMKQSFAVNFAAFDGFIEWTPAISETQNFLRCVSEIRGKNEKLTQVRFSQNVELRRRNAKELHRLAGLAGEFKISQGMQIEIEKMIRTFIRKSVAILERNSPL
jgi:hypothetical protein